MTEKPLVNPLFVETDGKSVLLDVDSGDGFPTGDVREKFAELSRKAPADPEFERAFVRNKLRMLKTDQQFSSDFKSLAQPQLFSMFPEEAEKEGPEPGGVGYGVFFKPEFRIAFATGSVLALDIICPRRPGGNVSTWLYLTATNRTAKGVEAFVLYNGQNDLRFRVFDWARDDHWQTDIGYEDLTDYFTTKAAHLCNYQVLSLQNQTYVVSGDTWRNCAWLYNYTKKQYDLIYSYEYKCTGAEQKEGWIGSWGPIVETFQESYSNTFQLGFLNSYMQSRDVNMNWSAWQLLVPENTTIRDDGLGFELVFLNPNHSFAVR